MGISHICRRTVYGLIAGGAASLLLVVENLTNNSNTPPLLVCVGFVAICSVGVGLMCGIWAWDDVRLAQATMTTRTPFGWLILGLCSGLSAGHFFAIAMVPQGYYGDPIFLTTMLCVEPIAAILGICGGAVAERANMTTGQPRLVKCWLLLFAATVVLLFLSIPAMFGARE